jgi:sterol-4alpha-carboxylate 3-dehydrogenase (decarboxylating)
MSNAKPNGLIHVVIGGSGFLGANIVSALVKRGETKVHSVDVREPVNKIAEANVTFHAADITSADSLVQVLTKIAPDVIYHTASPTAVGRNLSLYEKVNVHGTQNVISAAQRANVKALVFTSSASVVFEGNDLINVDERMPYAAKPFDLYNDTKARAEKLVLDANTDEDTQGLKTCALRPSGIFGPGDRQMIPGAINVVKTGKQNVQIGDNKNLTDWTYVENLVHAHLLAADKLVGGAARYPRELLAAAHLSDRSVGTLEPDSSLDRPVPTSEVRPDVLGATDYARSLPSTIQSVARTEDGQSTIDLRPVIRNKFDQFFHLVNPDVPSAGNPIPETISLAEESIAVAGEAFFITNNQPIPFWDMMRAVWREYDPESVDLKRVWHLSVGFGYGMAYLAEWFYMLSGNKEGTFDRYKVGYTSVARYFNIEKARRVLGYEPLYGLEEGIRRSVAWYKETEKQGQFDKKA